MEGNRRVTSVRQLELLIEYMEGHRDLALGRVRSKEARALAARLWEECAAMLNAEGAGRNSREWSRFWNDYKCRVRAKLSQMNRENVSTGGGPNPNITFSPLEDRVASLIGRDAGPLAGVRRDPIIDVVTNNNIQEDQQTYIVQDVSPTIEISNIQLDNSATTSHDDSLQLSPVVAVTNSAVIEAGRENVSTQATLPEQENRSSRPQRRSRTRPHPIYRNPNSELNEARASIARIEEMRTRMEETMATANLKQAEAALKQAESALKQVEAMSSIAQSQQIIAESIQSYLASLTQLPRNQQ